MAGESAKGWEVPVADQVNKDQGLSKAVPANARALRRERPGEARRYWLYGTRPEPMPSHIGPLEGPYEGRLGICSSGGGVRSAAYNLGALQSLQEAGELGRATYLAAVSGGSYIAAAFSMVAKAWPDGERPEAGKQRDDSDPIALERCKPFARGSPEEQYLRNRSSYLAPSGSDKLFLGFRVVLGLIFNLFFLSLPLFGIGLILGATFYWNYLPHLVGHCTQHSPCHADTPVGFWVLALAPVGLSVALGVVALIRRPHTEQRRQFLKTWSTRLLIVGGFAALLLVAVPSLVLVFHHSNATSASNGAPKPHAGAVGGVAGLAGLLAGIVAYVREALATPKQALEEAGSIRSAWSKLSAGVRKLLMYTAGALIGPLLLLAAYVLGVSLALASSDHQAVDGWLVALGLAALALFSFFYIAADLTTWSLHSFYKRRLCTAFALKRLRTSKLDPAELDRVQPAPPPHDPKEDRGVALERDFDELVELSDTALDAGKWPTLIVCAAANVSDPGAVPPGRNVTSFTFSAESIGGPLIGGAPTKEYETNVGEGKHSGWEKFRDKPVRSTAGLRDFSLPTAVAVSGAALAPSMGKMSRPPLRFLLALANIRLGVWIPNPRWVMATESEVRKYFKRARPSYLLLEILGRNRVDNRYLYVTDGGHYENLGLVELLRRGCTEIYCFDASGGDSFEELGDAIALARSELQIEIELDVGDLEPDKKTAIAKADTKTGTFTYANGTKGKIVYARTVLTAAAPWDVQAYHQVDPKFPHNSTVDQLYTDQKFEGYRMLGELAGKHAVQKMGGAKPVPAK